MKGYKQKINELQKQIEEKAKEFDTLSSIVEELIKQRINVGLDITKIEKEIFGKKAELKAIQERIVEEGQRVSSEAEPWKEKVKYLEGWVLYLGSLVGAKRADLKDIQEVEESIAKLEEVRGHEVERYKVVLAETESALINFKNILSESEKQKEENKKELEKIEGVRSSLQVMSKGLTEYNESLKFYARRLYKFYTEKGIAFPQDLLEDFRPLKYFPSRDLQKKLELKKKLKKLVKTQ